MDERNIGNLHMSNPPSDQFKRIEAKAIGTFGDETRALEWLNRTNFSLGMSPMEYLNAGHDENDVLKILNAIAYGGVV